MYLAFEILAGIMSVPRDATSPFASILICKYNTLDRDYDSSIVLLHLAPQEIPRSRSRLIDGSKMWMIRVYLPCIIYISAFCARMAIAIASVAGHASGRGSSIP